MERTHLDTILNNLFYPNEKTVTKNKVVNVRINEQFLKDESKNTTTNVSCFYNNDSITAKIVNRNNDKAIIFTYCYESDNILKLLYVDGQLRREYLSDGTFMEYDDDKSYKYEKNKLVEVYDKSGLIDSISYEYNDKEKITKELGSNYSIEYRYDRNNRLKRAIHIVDGEIKRDVLFVYRTKHYEIEDLVTGSTYYMIPNILSLPKSVTKYNKDNEIVYKSELYYILDDKTLV